MHAIYCRVSTTEQAERGYSIDYQLTACRDYAHKAGMVTVEEYVDDGYSGEYLERPALDKLREKLNQHQLSSVITLDPDRLSRNLTNQLLLADEIEKTGTKLFFTTADYDASPEGRLFFSIRGAVSAFEKAKTRERTMRGKRAKALQGKLTYNDKALGYNFDHETQMYIINENEAAIIRKIYELCVKKHYGVRTIATELNIHGYRTKNGKKFYSAAVWRILKNEMYAGTKWAFKFYDKLVQQRKKKRIIRPLEECVPITVPAIIDKETWNTAQRVLEENSKLSKRNTHNEYLLAKIIKCGYCGHNLIGADYAAHGTHYRYYRCSYKRYNNCPSHELPVELLDNIVWNKLLSLITPQVKIDPIAPPLDTQAAESKLLFSELKNLEARQLAILNWVRDGKIEVSAADQALNTMVREIADIKKAITRNQQETAATAPVTTDIPLTSFDQRRLIIIKSGLIIYARRDQYKGIYWGFGP
ncbi:MAG: Resolvase protein [Firmicutes bacterium]|nr:Resolvase protein [Bacillota bacterium]